MDVDTGYKQTEAGVLPEDWAVRTVYQIGTPVRGGSPRPAGDPRYFNGAYIPWLTVAALTNIPASKLIVSETATFLTEEGSRYSRILSAGVLIIANSGATLGVAKVLGVRCCANDGIAALLHLSKNVSVGYLAHYVNAQTSYLREIVATGNGQPNLNTTLIGNLKIILPPTKTEQEAIAEALSDADALIESLEQLVAKKRQLKQGAMQKLLTGNKRMPGFCGEWEVKRLDELGRWTGGMTPSMSNPDFWQSGTMPWVSSGDVKSARLTTTSLSISDYAIRRKAATVLPANSIILVTRSGILQRHLPVAMNTVPMAINQDIKALLPTNYVIPEYLLHSLIFNGDSILARCLKSGTTVESIEFRWLKAFTILIPSLTEQAAIAAILSNMDAEITALEAKLSKARQLKQGMMQELLTGRIRLV